MCCFTGSYNSFFTAQTTDATQHAGTRRIYEASDVAATGGRKRTQSTCKQKLKIRAYYDIILTMEKFSIG